MGQKKTQMIDKKVVWLKIIRDDIFFKKKYEDGNILDLPKST